ncbi:glycosyltransferase family 2 protein [Acinetobacter terrestris]|uniref:glycosyltransferase family 2 protein n=1 Tax=Acinetobacter terrestris TaxID=2529843 RepID=UPI00103E4667|nr:glycosyltransferase [Acinetobacter terrestris]TCB65702.1 glycosyltransferase [Acinetobacter terrestris]
MEYKLSVVIPIYNVEKYILDCIKSIFEILPREVEIIFIDDGSKDTSIDILQSEILKIDPLLRKNVILLKQENMGQSVARNNGIAVARGEYISFIDSDDLIDSSYFSEILFIINEYGPDIIRFNAAKFKNQDESIGKVLDFENFTGLCVNNKNLLEFIFKKGAWFSWLNVVKKNLFKDIQFPVGVYFEDVAIIPDLLIKSKNIFLLDRALYYYRINNQSSIHSLNEKNVEKNIESFKFILNLYRKKIYNNSLYVGIYIKLFQGYIGYLSKNRGISDAMREYFYFKIKGLQFDDTLNFKNKIFGLSGIIYIYMYYIYIKVMR